MTRMRKIWATGVFGLAGFLSLSVLVGHIPGAGSELSLFALTADLITIGVEAHGYAFTAFGIFLLGVILSILCLTASMHSHGGYDHDGGDAGDSGGCGGGD